MQRNRLIAVILITALMLLIVPLTVSAAANVADDKAAPQPAESIGPNLLSNPGLEGRYIQQCSLRNDPPWVPAPTPCDPENYDYASRALWATAQVPAGWAAWWRVPNSNYDDPNYYNSFPHSCQDTKKHVPADCRPWHNPEFRDTAGGPQETGPARRIEGENSQKYFTFYTVHDAGLYQIVNQGFKKGDRLRFSAYMMAWSSTENDPSKSTGQSTMGMQVGIDPYGGNNPWSPNIVWAPVQESWDTFSQFAVEAVAQGNMVSVWTRSQPTFAIQHNDVYVDAASLNVVAAAKPAPKPVTTRPVTSTKSVTTTKVTTRTVGTRVITSTALVTSTVVVTRYVAITTPASTAAATTKRVITSTKVVTGSDGLTRTVIVTSTITVPVSTALATTKQVVTSPKVVTGSTGVTRTVIVTSTMPASKPTTTVTTTKPVSGTQPIPASGIYTVMRGDTLIAIARRFGITPWWKLGEINGLKEPYKIEVGQVLKLR